jgi:DNA polymerase III epsilon subunit-like protein
MKFLFFDTETTGLPLRHAPASKVPNIWCYPVSIAWILADEDGTIINSEYHVIAPMGWEIPAEATAIHKITNSTAIKYGIPLSEAISRFMWHFGMCDVLVAHNLNFDQNVINNVLRWKLGKSMMLEDYGKRMFCTMINARSVVGLPGKTPGKFKTPKLSEMYKQLFGRDPVGVLHNAMTDTQVLMECFYRIWGTPCDLPAIPPILNNVTDNSVVTTLNISLTDAT